MKKLITKSFLVLMLLFNTVLVFSQVATIEGFASGWTNQTFNPGTEDQVYMYQSGSTVSSATVNCFGSSAGRYSVKPDATGDYFETQLNYAGTSKAIDQVSFNVTANSTTAGQKGHYGWSTDGTTWTDGGQFTMPTSSEACLLITVAAPVSGTYKYFRIMRNSTSTTWAGTLGSAQTIRIYSMRVWTKSTCTAATAYNVGGTATISSGNSTDITLSGSTEGLNYQLYKGGVADGSSVAGTGSALSWTVTPATSSTYTVKSLASGITCETAMTGSAVVTVNQSVPMIELTSAAGTSTQTVTVNSAITNITYSVASGTATTATIAWTGTADSNTPPAGISTDFVYPTFTISGTPTSTGSYGYTITTDGTPAAEATGTLSSSVYATGDFVSVATGNWDTPATWKKWNGTGFTNPATDYPNSATANVYVSVDHVVTYATGGRSMKNLSVDGTLKSSSIVNTPAYLNVYGDIVVSTTGVIGDIANMNGASASGISISTYGSSTQTISGAGNISVSRLRLNSANTVIADANLYINYHGTSNTGNASALYPMQTGSTFTINSGKTVTMDKWASIYLNTSSTAQQAYSFTMNINGTLVFLEGSPTDPVDKTLLKSYLACNNSSNNFAINIGETGVLTLNELYLNGNSQTGTSTGTASMVNNGILNVKSLLDLSRNALQTITGTGTVNIPAGSELKIANADGLNNSTGNLLTTTVNYDEGANYTYAGTSAQVAGALLPATVNNLTVNNAAGLTLSATQSVSGILTLTSGKLSIGDNNLTVSGGVSGASATNYVVTGGTGKLIQPALAATEITFPVGSAVDSYDPVALTPADATSIAVKVGTTLPADAPSRYTYNAKVWDITPVAASLTLVKLTPSSAIATQISDVIGHYTGSEYVNVTAVKTGSTYEATFTSFSPFVTGTTDIGTGMNGENIQSSVYLDGKIMRNLNSQNIILIDVSGRQLLNTHNEIDLSNYSQGIYFIRAENVNLKISLTR